MRGRKKTVGGPESTAENMSGVV